MANNHASDTEILRPDTELCIQFAHPTYRFAETIRSRNVNYKYFQTWNTKETLAEIEKADVLAISGFWEDGLLEKAGKLKYIQSISAGYEQFPLDKLKSLGIRLCTASGVNADAVSHHAMGLVLSLARQLHIARDNQTTQHWRSWISDRNEREQDLSKKTMLIIGLGEIGSRLSRIAKAFGMIVIGVKNDITKHNGSVDELHPTTKFKYLLKKADFVVLTCPLTPDTRNLIDETAIAEMQESCYLINVARGGCINEKALLQALKNRQIAGAAIDHFLDEPLPQSSPFWSIENLIITPHTGGETAKYEDNLIDILLENIRCLNNKGLTEINRVV